MNHDSLHTERLHALDNLRAVMMWLGIVLHVGIIYTFFPLSLPLPWHDTKTTLFADWLVALIHCFRMPVFFMLAGFFVVMLVQSRGTGGMLANRLKRVALPFVILWPPIFVFMVLMVLVFAHRAARGTWGLDPLLVPNTRPGHPLDNTMHLWFLWMLTWFAVLSAALVPLARRVPQVLRAHLSAVFVRVASSSWGVAVLALPLGLVGACYKEGFVTASGHFFAPWMEWVHNGLFFGFGLALYPHRRQLFALYQSRWIAHALAGFTLYSVVMLGVSLARQGQLVIPYSAFWIALLFNACSWLFGFSLIGLFLRFLGHKQPTLDYLAQSSYWVYVIHMPLTVGFGAALYGMDMPALAKIVINILLTTMVALLSYHLLVRSSLLGRLLNGRRYPFTLTSVAVSGAAQIRGVTR